MKENKGYYGYVKKERVRRLLICIGLFLLPLIVFLAGLFITHTTKNMCSVIAVVGCLPGCKAIVGLIMIFIARPMDEADYKAIEAHKGEMLVGYELYLTSYDNSEMICSACVAGCQIIAYSNRLKNPPEMMEEHIERLMLQNGFQQKVKLFTTLDKYLDRLDALNAHKDSIQQPKYTPDPHYPDYSRDQLVMHLLYRLAL